MIRVVVDTSVFTNPDSMKAWGPSHAAALDAFIAAATVARTKVAFYMPPSIYEELRTFLGGTLPPPTFELVVSLQAPDRYGVVVPGHLLYELIDDLRGRIDKGLRVAEKAVRETHPERVEETITRLRGSYRSTLRAGLLDSREDVDLVLLAKELDAALVSSDEGVQSWAERMAIRQIRPENLRAILEELSR